MKLNKEHIKTERWLIRGEHYRENDLSAVIHYNEYGEIKEECWYENGIFRNNKLY